MKKLIFTFALICLCGTMVADVYTGTIGDSLNWSVDTQSGELKLTGSGSTFSYSDRSHAPWYGYRESIKYVTMADPLQHIGSYAFDGCSNLFYCNINADSLGSSVFNNCNKLALLYCEQNTKANSQTMEGCQRTPVMIANDYYWYQELYGDSLGLDIAIYPYSIDYKEYSFDDLINAMVELRPSASGISVNVSRGRIPDTPLKIKDFFGFVWKDELIAPLVYELTMQGVEYLGKNSFEGCTKMKRITFLPNYTDFGAPTETTAFAYLDTIDADAFDGMLTDIIDLYQETKFQPGKVENYEDPKCNLNQTLVYVPDTLSAQGNEMLGEYSITPFWRDNFGEISNKTLSVPQYVDTAEANITFYYEEVIDSAEVAEYHMVLYKIGSSDTVSVYFSNDTSFVMKRMPRVVQIIDSVTGTTTTVTISINNAAFNESIEEVNVHMEHLAANSTYSITITPLDLAGNELDSKSSDFTTEIPDGVTDVYQDEDDTLFYPSSNTDVYTFDGKYLGKYRNDLPAGIYLMRENGKGYKFIQTLK